MRKPEQRLWDTMRRVAAREQWPGRLTRLENSVSSGMPDVIATKAFGEVNFIELKVFTMPARDTTCPLKNAMRQEQKNWFLEAARFKLQAYVLARESESKQLYLFHGFEVETFDVLPKKHMKYSLTDWDWIFHHLL